jgi:hypothetical protein
MWLNWFVIYSAVNLCFGSNLPSSAREQFFISAPGIHLKLHELNPYFHIFFRFFFFAISAFFPFILVLLTSLYHFFPSSFALIIVLLYIYSCFIFLFPDLFIFSSLW